MFCSSFGAAALTGTDEGSGAGTGEGAGTGAEEGAGTSCETGAADAEAAREARTVATNAVYCMVETLATR